MFVAYKGAGVTAQGFNKPLKKVWAESVGNSGHVPASQITGTLLRKSAVTELAKSGVSTKERMEASVLLSHDPSTGDKYYKLVDTKMNARRGYNSFNTVKAEGIALRKTTTLSQLSVTCCDSKPPLLLF